MIETKPCKECRKKMVRFYFGPVIFADTVQFQETWWCLCGNTETEFLTLMQPASATEKIHAAWKEANKGA